MTPRHIGIIMDGNGRWANKRMLPRVAGHRAGMETLRRIVRHSGEIGLEWLTLYAFSSENWSRPADEVTHLLSLLKLFIRRDLADLHESNVRIRIIGERRNLSADILALLNEAETLTAQNSGLNLVIAFNYGGRNEIIRAVQKLAERVAAGELTAADISETVLAGELDTAAIPDPDLIIRTSGEIRLSNFLLWQSAYSELCFMPCLWPDFSVDEFDAAIANFYCRDRRFGAVSPTKDIKDAVG